jgi:hypothetical protein
LINVLIAALEIPFRQRAEARPKPRIALTVSPGSRYN